MKGLKKIITVASFSIVLAVLAGVGVYSFFDKDESVSQMENRTLAQMPVFLLKSYFSGDFASDFEEYYNDQFPARATLVKIGSKIESFFSCLRLGDGETIIQGQGGVGDGEALSRPTESTSEIARTSDSTDQTVINSSEAVTKMPEVAINIKEEGKETLYAAQYIILLNNRAMEMYTNSYKKIDVYIDTLNRIKTNLPGTTKVYCMLAPTSIEFYASGKYNQGKSKSQYEGISYAYSRLNGITPVDAYSEIAAHANEYLYFRTDHHWTARGAYYAYLSFAKTAKITPVDIKSLKSGKLEPFLGSLYRITQSVVLEKDPDFLEYFVPNTSTKAIAASDAAMKNSYGIKVISTNITSMNKYLAFIEGDNPVTKITTDAPGNKSILVVKESYGNAFVPWLCNNYSEVYVIDPRMLAVNIADFVRSNSIQEVLFLNYTFIPTNNTYMTALEKMG